MWNSFPIQTHLNKDGIEGSLIDRDYKYERFPDVCVTTWKECPSDIRGWCKHIWHSIFKTVRDPIGDNDLIGWIPSKGTITAKYGKWIGENKSKNVVLINYLYIDPSQRGKNLANQLIQSIGNESAKIWGTTTFLFEADVIPSSLSKKGAIPLCKYHYGWIPFVPSKLDTWKEIPITEISSKGFHGNMNGYKLYQNTFGDKLLFDPNDDIVWYTNFYSIFSFDGFLIGGAYCRVFTPYGSSAIFAHNMYFTPSYSTHYLL